MKLPSCPAPWLAGAVVTFILALSCRMLELPMWQNPEFSFDNEMLLATHDAYHWVAGATGFGAAIDHPMALFLRALAALFQQLPANVAFWSPPILASLVAVLTFLWARALGADAGAIAAGLVAAISPGFLGRTLLGFYDTDLVTLLFPLIIALPPALWCRQFLLSPGVAWRNFTAAKAPPPEDASRTADMGDAPQWLWLLACTGVMAHWCQQWHSVFPYLIRFNVILLLLMTLCLRPRGTATLLSPLVYGLTCALGIWGLAPVALIAVCQCRAWPYRRSFLIIVWLAVLVLLAQGEIINTLLSQINAYLKHTGDSHASGGASLIFPSVAQSIVEVQDLALTAMFPYFHPWANAAMLGFLGFAIVILARPAALFLLPLAALGLLSSHLGGRMVMFGAPIVAIGLVVPSMWICRLALRRWLSPRMIGWLGCFTLILGLVVPYLDMIPAMSQGPILNRRHAAALAQAGVLTPPDATLWLWWDWGYAAQYFAHRYTIADGARHGGPSLYLPAAALATDNARFARQIIRFASTKDNEPGNFFRDLGPTAAQDLMDKLRSSATPLITGKGKQYILVSFEMLKLGFWISNFGNWNFVTCQGEGGALSIVPQAVAYRLKSGEVRLEGQEGIIFPTSISLFAETGLQHRNYVRQWFAAHPGATAQEQQAFLASRRNVNFLFNLVTEEKLAVDEGIYNSLMVQLLLCDAHDPRFAPYFRLIYDNVFARIYEVVP